MDTRRNSTAQKIQTPRNSQDDTNDTFASSQNSQGQKLRARNYTAEESEALIRCSEKYHAIISKNTGRDKDKKEKIQAWNKIKSDFDQYCQSQGIYVSTVGFPHISFDFRLSVFCVENLFAVPYIS